MNLKEACTRSSNGYAVHTCNDRTIISDCLYHTFVVDGTNIMLVEPCIHNDNWHCLLDNSVAALLLEMPIKVRSHAKCPRCGQIIAISSNRRGLVNHNNLTSTICKSHKSHLVKPKTIVSKRKCGKGTLSEAKLIYKILARYNNKFGI